MYDDEVTTLADSALREMDLSAPEGWSVGYKHEPRDDGWWLVVLVSDDEALLYESEVDTEEGWGEGDLREVCTDALLGAMAQEGI